MKSFDLIETKLFHFHRIFKNGGRGGGFERTLWTPSGSTTAYLFCFKLRNCQWHTLLRSCSLNRCSSTAAIIFFFFSSTFPLVSFKSFIIPCMSRGPISIFSAILKALICSEIDSGGFGGAVISWLISWPSPGSLGDGIGCRFRGERNISSKPIIIGLSIGACVSPVFSGSSWAGLGGVGVWAIFLNRGTASLSVMSVGS